MKNNFIKILTFLILYIFLSSKLHSEEIFNFNVTEIEITQNGNLVKGYDGGEVFTNDGMIITADEFEYNKIENTLIAKKNVKFKDKIKKISIIADNILYFKKKEKIIAKGNVLIEDKLNNSSFESEKITYLKNSENIIAEKNVNFSDFNRQLRINANKISYEEDAGKIVADQNVKVLDSINDVNIEAEKITYIKKSEKIFSEGKTFANIKSKYKFYSSNLTFLKNEMRLFSSSNTTIDTKNQSRYVLGSFDYQIDKEFLKGKDISIIENTNLSAGDTNTYYFANGFFDLNKNYFKTGPVKVLLKKNTFGRSDNDPRLYGTYSSHENGITTVKKGVFTSCKKRDGCPPWKIEASEIKHDKNKKKLIYENSILKFYDIPVFYFPKFFHPDPTVNRQSGFLIPKLNNSNILGTSLSVPYFHVIAENKDMTFNPILFSKNTKMLQSEYRQENENSSFITDFSFTNGYKSSATQKKKNINHFFARFEKNLELKNFIKSEFNLFLEKTNKDTFLKVFSDNLSESKIKPINSDILNSGFDFALEHQNFTLKGGADIYEDLKKQQSDRYQFVFPYYEFNQNPKATDYGIFNLSSSGSYILDNTNNVKSRVINDLSFNMNDYLFQNIGLKNNLNFYFKNLNSIGKNVDTYKSSPQIEIQSLFEFKSELPLAKLSKNSYQTLIPKMSLRFNPSDMKDHSSDKRRINTNNIFNINRLGISDSLESGNSLTVGVDYKSQKNKNTDDNYFELKIASVFRDEEKNNIPSQTTLNKKNSNIFGSIDYKVSKFLNLDYDFSFDNKFENLNYNSIGLDLSINNFITEFNFIEENSLSENTNVFESIIEYKFNDQNSFGFKTRRNREINLTEYYNLVYEYKNDCLTAGIRFNKTYYEDRDLKPSENLMFTISFYPITTIEQSGELFLK